MSEDQLQQNHYHLIKSCTILTDGLLIMRNDFTLVKCLIGDSSKGVSCTLLICQLPLRNIPSHRNICIYTFAL